MIRRFQIGWFLGALLAAAVGAATISTASAAAKVKAVHYTGVVKTVTATSITLQERHMLIHRDVTHELSASPKVTLTTGAGTTADVPAGAKVELTGTEGPDKKVTITEIKVLSLPKASSKKR
jgi:hypothetical protein